MILSSFLSLEGHIEGFGEILPKIVTGTGLKGFFILHHGFNRVGFDCTGEFFRFTFLTRYHRYRHVFLGELSVNFQHLQGFRFTLRFSRVGCVDFEAVGVLGLRANGSDKLIKLCTVRDLKALAASALTQHEPKKGKKRS